MTKSFTRTPKKQLHYQKLCKLCNMSVKNKKVHEMIINSRKFYPGNKDAVPLKEVARNLNVHYNSMIRHVTKHVAVSPDELSEREMDRIIRRNDKASTIQEYDAGAKATDVWNEVIEKAKVGLQDGSIKLTANHLLKAAKDKSDYEIKKKSQDMAIQEMMWHFASGEALGSTQYDTRRIIEGEEGEAYDPTQVFAGFIDEGETRSSGVHPGTTGDAPTPRSSEILDGDDF